MQNMYVTIALLAVSFGAGLLGCHRRELPEAPDHWLGSIATSADWAVFPCEKHAVSDTCWTGKEYSDPGSLPPIVSVGDTISYLDKHSSRKSFVVRRIKYFEFAKDIDESYGGEHLVAKKGEAICTLYDVQSLAQTKELEYPSKLYVRGCRSIR